MRTQIGLLERQHHPLKSPAVSHAHFPTRTFPCAVSHAPYLMRPTHRAQIVHLTHDPAARRRGRLHGGAIMRDERESPSGAMHSGEAAGTPGAPLPRTDAADPGEGTSGMGDRDDRSSVTSGHDGATRPLDAPRGQGGDPDAGNHGIGGAPAGGF